MRRLAFVLFIFVCNADKFLDEWPSSHLQQTPNTPLNGKHLRLITLPIPGIYDEKRNATGHVVQTAGPVPLALDWLSRRYNFTYFYIPIIGPMIVDDLPNQRGGISFLRQGEADFYLGAIVATVGRFKDTDFASSWMSTALTILIPIPNSSTNIGALIEPMSIEVWICIGLSIPTVILSLFGLSQCIVALNKKFKSNQSNTNSSRGNFQITDYVLTVLLSQGGYCVRKQLAIRLAAAAWCLACFVLVQAYSSTLIAFITSPNNKPIINSVYDIPNVPGLKITVTRNFGADVILQQANFGIYKKLGDSLREDPSLRCNVTETCLNKVRYGNYVYIHGTPVLKKIIATDREQTGTCHFTMAAESFWPGGLFFLLQKKSPYTETINRGILRMQETGLLEKWIESFNPETKECSLKSNNKKKTGNRSISLKNFTSAFALLLFGVSVSFLVFFVELVYPLCRFNNNSR